MDRPTILIISDESEFTSSIISSWRAEENTPAFVLKTSEECNQEHFDLAIVGGLHDPAQSILKAVRGAEKPVIHVSRMNGSTPKLACVVSLPEVPGWPELLITLATQILERERAAAEVSRLLEANAQLECQALLGRYMIETRHNLNNALTSILGNCDLMLLDQDEMSSAAKVQVETVRNMGMRVNEIMQRFSSLQKEMQLVEQQKKASSKSAAAGA